jgi:hypothetical protein
MEGFLAMGRPYSAFNIQHYIIGFSIWPSVSTFVKIASLSKNYAYEMV